MAPPRAPPARGKGISHLEMDDTISRADDLRAARSAGAGAASKGIVMNLEHCRKNAKRLLRAVAAGDADALARATDVIGARVQERFGLSDAQHVIAREQGYRSWPALVASAESMVDTGLRYMPADPVRVWVRRRERRVSVSDHAVALDKAGRPPGWHRACGAVLAELDVNITRAGVVWLPVVAAGPPEHEVVHRIGRASLAFFQELLELR